MENKKEKYELLCKQVEQLIAGETDEMAVFSNVAAALKEAFPGVLLGRILSCR